MRFVVMTIPFNRLDQEYHKRTNEIYKWLGENVVNDWALNRLTMDAVRIDMWGTNQEQDMVAFKLKFGL